MSDSATILAIRILDALEKEYLPPYGDEERDVVADLIRKAAERWSTKTPGAKVTRRRTRSRRD